MAHVKRFWTPPTCCVAVDDEDGDWLHRSNWVLSFQWAEGWTWSNRQQVSANTQSYLPVIIVFLLSPTQRSRLRKWLFPSFSDATHIPSLGASWLWCLTLCLLSLSLTYCLSQGFVIRLSPIPSSTPVLPAMDRTKVYLSQVLIADLVSTDS